MHSSCPPCSGTCNQGRECLACLNATRAVFRLAPLHQQDGGVVFRHGYAFPIADDPLPEVHTQTPTPTRRGGLLAALRKLIKL